MVLSGFAGFFISFTTAWCLRVAPSTTYSMVGALNKLPVALSGLIFFPSERLAVNTGYIISIIISFSAGLVYSYSQILKKKSTVTVTSIESDTTTKSSIIDVLSDYENRLGIKATYEELIPKIQNK
jgi:GDP-mannose transporter